MKISTTFKNKISTIFKSIKDWVKNIFSTVEKTIAALVIFGILAMIVILISLAGAGVFSSKNNNVVETKKEAVVIETPELEAPVPVIPTQVEIELNNEIEADIQVERQAEMESNEEGLSLNPATEVVFNDEVSLTDMEKLKELLSQYSPLYSSHTNTLTINQASKKVYLSQSRLSGWFQIGTYNLDRINNNDFWRSNRPTYVKLHNDDFSGERGTFFYRSSEKKVQALILDIVNKFLEEGASDGSPEIQ